MSAPHPWATVGSRPFADLEEVGFVEPALRALGASLGSLDASNRHWTAVEKRRFRAELRFLRMATWGRQSLRRAPELPMPERSPWPGEYVLRRKAF